MNAKPISECKTVLELLSDPSRWIKGETAKMENGMYCSSQHPDAVRFCLAGAIERIYGMPLHNYHYDEARQKLIKVFDKKGFLPQDHNYYDYIYVNDDPDFTYAQMIECVRQAGI